MGKVYAEVTKTPSIQQTIPLAEVAKMVLLLSKPQSFVEFVQAVHSTCPLIGAGERKDELRAIWDGLGN